MIKKILITILLVFLIPNNSFAKAPPLGTGSLVPSNIMIMLDNSGSMAWDLAGAQLSSDSYLNFPTDIKFVVFVYYHCCIHLSPNYLLSKQMW